MTTLRSTPIHRALHRPNLLLGGERELVLFTALVAGGLAVSAMNMVATAVSVFLWLIGVAVLRRMAKADPQMSRIYTRHVQYRAYYAPHSTPFRNN